MTGRAPRSAGSRPALDFVGIGAARCGTTWLARCLGEHPAIFIPPRKELKYFDNDFLYEPTLRRLRRHFRGARPDQLRGELSPRYMTSPTGLRRLEKACPEARIIVSLREPVERMFSDYCFFRFNLKREPIPDFVPALEGPNGSQYLARSRYALHLEHVLRIFAREQVHFILYEDITRRPRDVMAGLFDFLGVDRRFAPSMLTRRVNRAGDGRHAPRAAWARFGCWMALGDSRFTRLARPAAMPVFNACNRLVDGIPVLRDRRRRPRLAPELRRRLHERHFRDDMERTERMTGLDLSVWTARYREELDAA